MKRAIKRQLSVNVGWVLGSVAGILALVGATGARFEARSVRIAERLDRIASRRAELLQPDPGQEREQRTAERLAGCVDVLESESRRVSELSRAARGAGVTIVALEVRDEEVRADGLRSVAHELSAVGSYDELGRFLSGLHSATGALGVRELSLAREESAAAGRLRAALTVVWYATGPAPAPPGPEGEGG